MTVRGGYRCILFISSLITQKITYLKCKVESGFPIDCAMSLIWTPLSFVFTTESEKPVRKCNVLVHWLKSNRSHLRQGCVPNTLSHWSKSLSLMWIPPSLYSTLNNESHYTTWTLEVKFIWLKNNFWWIVTLCIHHSLVNMWKSIISYRIQTTYLICPLWFPVAARKLSLGACAPCKLSGLPFPCVVGVYEKSKLLNRTVRFSSSWEGRVRVKRKPNLGGKTTAQITVRLWLKWSIMPYQRVIMLTLLVNVF